MNTGFASVRNNFNLEKSFASKARSSSRRKYGWFVLVRVTSWIVLFSGLKERSTKSHELNTKLVTTVNLLLRQALENSDEKDISDNSVINAVGSW